MSIHLGNLASVIGAIALCLLICAALAPSCPASTHSYEQDPSVFGNPERGWFVFRELKPTGANTNQWATEELLRGYYGEGYRLAKHVVHLPTNSRPLPPDFLGELQAEADLCRRMGFKVIYRFNYNWNHDVSRDDAALDSTLAHLDQLEPFFARNKDVLFALEMGFIGYWGEMHHSTHGHTDPHSVGLSDSGKAILRKALAVVPSDRSVSIRYPKVIYTDPEEYGSLGYMQPLDEGSAYSGSDQSRLGSWYANFGAGDILYHHDAELLRRWAPETRYVPQWAHCDHFEDVSTDPWEWLADARAFHYRALSNPKDETDTRDIYGAWVRAGTYDEFAKRLGYRYQLLESTVADIVALGEALPIQLKLRNDGWGRPVNPRILEVVLRNRETQGEHVHRVVPPRDSRLWFPGPESEVMVSLEVPIAAKLPAGRYDLFLSLPDPEPSIRGNPAYSIRLASVEGGRTVWEPATGYNRLGHVVEVTDGRSCGASRKQ